ncbi:NAD(P)-dependent oxidoreductase [Lutibaculum baratangense]|uniref:NAD(P)-dependent oxidoreductase n=1 Tax=Lutibaculum baratangense TaxID=1358440 RepID=UPI0009DCB8DE|nr:NAD(P)-dependent oxidoreductase [Lutibaculum baratangense]
MAGSRVAVLGIGLMGAPMARRLLAAGHEVTVWNRTRAKAEALAAEGARVADTPAEAVRGAAIVVTMLENGPIVGEVLFQQGAAEALDRDAIVVDMSSIQPSMARDHAKRLGELGARHLDAPVSGGTVGAEQGTLAIMVGGDAADVEKVRPVLEAMGRVTHVGPSGAGQLVKLANQTIVAVNIGAVAEALLLAAAGGADPAAARAAMRGGFADSRILEVHGQRMLDRDFAPRGMVRMHFKDLNTIVAEAEAIGLDLPLAAQMRDRFQRMVDELELAEADHSAVLLELEDRNKPHRGGTGPDRFA